MPPLTQQRPRLRPTSGDHVRIVAATLHRQPYLAGNRLAPSRPGGSEDLESMSNPNRRFEVTTDERKARLQELFAAGWTTDLFAEFWAEPDLTYIPSIITDDVVGYWPGGRTVRGAEQYVKALEELLGLLPDLHLDVAEHTMTADGEFGFSRWVMHATGASGPFELVGMDRTRVRDGLVCENYVLFDSRQFDELVGK